MADPARDPAGWPATIEELVTAWCDAPDWPAAAVLLRQHGDALLGAEAAEVADRMQRRHVGREFEQAPHRLRVLARCRIEAPGDVLLEPVAADELGPDGPAVLQPSRDQDAATAVAAAATEVLEGGNCAGATRGLVLMRRARANLTFGPTPPRTRACVADLEEAARLLTAETHPSHHAQVLRALGEARRRTDTGDPAAEVERAIVALKDGLDQIPDRRSLTAGYTMNSLGDAYGRRLVGEPQDNLRRAARLLESAFKVFANHRKVREQAAAARNLASVSARRPDLPAHRRLIEAFRWSQRAEDLYLSASSPLEVARTRADLGLVCAAYAQAEHVPVFHRHAVDLIDDAGDEWAELDATDFAGCQATLGAALQASAVDDEERRRAVHHATVALERLDESSVVRRMGVLSNRGLARLELGEWEPAAADLCEAATLSEAALAATELPPGELAVVRRLTEAFPSAVRALAYLGRYDEAFAMVERSRARLLTRALAISSDAVPGDVGLASPGDVPDGCTLVSLAVSMHGTTAFVVPASTGTLTRQHTVMLPGLTGGRLRELTVGTRDGTPGLLMRTMMLELSQTEEEYDEALADLVGAVDATLAVLGEELVAPVAERLMALHVDPGTRLVLAPDGELSTLPLHAAPTGDGKLGDRWPTSYVPSLTVLRALGDRSAPLPPAPAGLAIVDETGTLPLAPVEVDRLKRRLPARRLKRLQPTERLADAYGGEQILHFACHGRHEWSKVGASSVEVHAGVPLTADEIAGLDLRGCRVVVLSACESGLSSFIQVQDEFLGLPSAFLRAGADAVVCSLWRVDDLATALLIDAFHAGLLEQHLPPPAALQRASVWLRSSTAAALLATAPWLPVHARDELAALAPGERPFADAYSWAGFVVVGG